MSAPERPSRRPRQHPDSGPPLHPSPLPPDLAESLKARDFACLTHPTDHGTAFIIKAPARDIESVRGTVQIELRHELYAHSTAPVIRIVTVIQQPDSALALESFINVQDEQQRSGYESLATQDRVHMLFYDETSEAAAGRPETMALATKRVGRGSWARRDSRVGPRVATSRHRGPAAARPCARLVSHI